MKLKAEKDQIFDLYISKRRTFFKKQCRKENAYDGVPNDMQPSRYR